VTSGSFSPTSSSDADGSLKSEPPTGGVTRYPDWNDLVHAIERAAHPRDREELTEREQLDSALDLQGFRLSGFGSRLDDCGECVPESRHFCTECGDLEAIPRNCFRYDCPGHAAQAIRRRAAGTDPHGHPGVVPKLDALARRLGSYYGERFNFYHMAISPPEDYVFESNEPLRRAVGVGDHDGVIREIMDALGIQGVVAAHSHRGENEEPGADDMGEWRERLPPWSGSDRDWRGDVKEELSAEPHFHVVGVAPWEPKEDEDDVGTLEGTERVEDETGWVIHAIEGSDGSTVIGSDVRNDHQKRKAVARAVTYALSHALVYDAGDDRRLGAWLKGPDVNSTDVPRWIYEDVHTVTQQVASDTLGVNPPSLECDNHVRREFQLGALEDETLSDLERHSQQRDPLDPSYHEPLSGWSGPGIATSSPNPSGLISASSGGGGHDGVAGMSSPPNELPDGSSGRDSGGSGSTLSSRTSSRTTENKEDFSDGAGRNQDGADQDGLVECGGHLDHISQAGAKLADPEWVATAPHSRELDRYYNAYTRLMAQKGLEPEDGRTEIPEFEDIDGPPPD
jgi:hypothetical protein